MDVFSCSSTITSPVQRRRGTRSCAVCLLTEIVLKSVNFLGQEGGMFLEDRQSSIMKLHYNELL